jgi:hypothetical protein
MEDGRLTPFRWLSSGDTGYATASGADLYHGPGRGSANSVNALLDGHRLAPDQGFLALAEALIRRVIHPHDDIGARDLFDIERKWFYTIFLQVLAKYLDVKATLDQRDAMYAYGRASLLHYARWMREHEYFYLDRPERLEFPTESWAAQEMRKSEVFDFAAFHAEEPERAAFRERAASFYERSLASLSTFATRTRARPLVIMLTNGFRHRYFLEHPMAAAAPPLAALGPLGPPPRFIPQKAIAMQRFKWLIAAGTVATLAAILAVLL